MSFTLRFQNNPVNVDQSVPVAKYSAFYLSKSFHVNGVTLYLVLNITKYFPLWLFENRAHKDMNAKSDVTEKMCLNGSMCVDLVYHVETPRPFIRPPPPDLMWSCYGISLSPVTFL